MGTPADPAEIAYRHTAAHYDEFTAHHDYRLWLGNLLAELDRLGLDGNRLLDVACGTGKSFLPMLERGWRVTAVDISAEMLAVARAKAGDAVDLRQCDMRELPRLGSFDLVWCLGDAVNYLLGVDGLERALRALAENLSAGGLVLFDVNTLAMYRDFFASSRLVDLGDHRLVWNGRAGADTGPGAEVVATLDIETPDGELVRRVRHRQRHYPAGEVRATLARAGLHCLAVYGVDDDAVLQQPLDEVTHTKAVFIARRGERR